MGTNLICSAPKSHGPVDNAYGYMYIETDVNGDGVITVMFSNASEVDLARFNARVKFLDESGAVVGEEYFDCWIDAEGYREAIECKLSRPLTHSGFESIEVDFYLTDVPGSSENAATGSGRGLDLSRL